MSTAKTQTRGTTRLSDAPAETELRDYRLHARIGDEELATVYAATHLTLDHAVEVHILRRTDWISASRFQLAARLGAHLSHPNLVPVRDAGHDDHYGDYLVTPTLDAQPLHLLLENGPLEPVLALRIATHIAAALDYLHSEQVFHRDVQPNNILLSSQGIAYLTSLSLASSPDTPDLSSIDEADYLTPYSAPEQHLDQGEAAPALDIYSLGAVLYHMLSGEIPPAPGTEPPTLASQDPNLAPVDPILQRMMALQPEERFGSAGESITVLRRAMRGYIDQATDDMEESRWEPVAEWLENPLETILGSVLPDVPPALPDAEAPPIEQEDAEQPAPAPPSSRGALHDFQEYLHRSRARADKLHRADTIRRLLTRWSRKGFFRRPALGQIIQLEQIVSYNIYFYELRTLYETRTQPETRQRIQQQDDQSTTLPPPDLWDIIVPDTEPFAEVRTQELVVPNSTSVLTCPTCGGTAEINCEACEGSGTVERLRKVRNPDGSTSQEALPEQCSACRGCGKLTCAACQGTGSLVQEDIFTWSRRALLWENTDDIEGLPRLALNARTEPVCSAPIDPYKGHWHSVAPLDALLQSAIASVEDANTHIIAAELQIRGVPITEVDYLLNDTSQRLYLIGFADEVVGNWGLFNPERIALAAIALLILLALLVAGVLLLL
jgi:serine/threonine protein kinase